MKLEFYPTFNGGLQATYKRVKFVVYHKNAGYDWFIIYPDDDRFTPIPNGRKYNDELDCCCTTIKGTIEDLADFVSSPTNRMEWVIQNETKAMLKKLHLNWNTLKRKANRNA